MRNRLRALWTHLKTEHATPGRLAVAVFVGINLGVWPIYGIQTPICLLVAWLFKLNKLTVVLAANISNPLIAPFLVAGGIAIGEWVRFGALHRPDLDLARGFIHELSLFAGQVPSLYVSCFIGDAILGLVLGVLFALAAYRVATRSQRARAAEGGA